MALRLVRTTRRHPQGRGCVMGVTGVGIRDAYVGAWRGEYETAFPRKIVIGVVVVFDRGLRVRLTGGS